jgi:hypothetical protein
MYLYLGLRNENLNPAIDGTAESYLPQIIAWPPSPEWGWKIDAASLHCPSIKSF